MGRYRKSKAPRKPVWLIWGYIEIHIGIEIEIEIEIEIGIEIDIEMEMVWLIWGPARRARKREEAKTTHNKQFKDK